MPQPRRTPCVGICSTTYGDLVCRGCKRFAHEIVQWNGYAPKQQEQIWRRLYETRDTAALHHLRVLDEAAFTEAKVQYGIDAQASEGEQRYELLRALVVAGVGLQDSGMQGWQLASEERSQGELPLLESEALEMMRALDAEIYRRSLAYYEQAYRVPV